MALTTNVLAGRGCEASSVSMPDDEKLGCLPSLASLRRTSRWLTQLIC